ncbi:MAG: DNA mismatch repair protein MutS [Armatimonadota bacterium]
MSTDALTPMFRQYQELKRQYPDVILLFRCGDFYELYGEDAVIGAQAMDISLTSREMRGARLPMAGVPYHAIDRYLSRLLSAGFKAAIAEQMEDPKLAKGLVKREVTRIMTPGTIVEDYLLDERSNNYLLALHTAHGYGLAVADCSTGEFSVTEVSTERARELILEEVSRLQPAEILLSEDLKNDETLMADLRARTNAAITTPDTGDYAWQTAVDTLTQHFGVSSLRGFGCEEMPLAVEAAGLLMRYLQQTQKTTVGQIRTMSTYALSDLMMLDASTRRNLELIASLRDGGRTHSLLWLLDHTCTAMGARMLKKWLLAPLLDVDAINRRQDAVEAFREDGLLRDKVREELRNIHDLERLLSRAASGSGNARDLGQLRDSLTVIPCLLTAMEDASPVLKNLVEGADTLTDLRETLAAGIVDSPPISVRDGGMIRAGYNQELDTLRRASTEGKDWIAALETSERERTGIKSLKVGFNNVFGYYIEVTRSGMDLVPGDYIRKQTLANAERFITPALKEYEAMVLGAEDKLKELEFKLFTALRGAVAMEADRIQSLARLLAQVDVLADFAEVAARNRYHRPKVVAGTTINIHDGRHPVVEQTLAGERFVPNDAHLDTESDQLIILTGPNMAGKSTWLRQVALITLLAQVGSFVSADEAEIGVVDRIFTRVGASDDLATGQSTFMMEMTEAANILNNATDKSLVILDEIGRGTSTFDGLSIAWAVAEYLHESPRLGCKTLFATHYHQLNELENTLPRAKNYRIAVKEGPDGIVFLRKIVPGGTDRSYGIHVAKLAGLPPEVLDRAQQVLQSLEENDQIAEHARGLVDRHLTIPPPLPKTQLTLFEVVEHPVVDELMAVDVDDLTPRQALDMLARLQKKAGRSK